MAPPQSAPVDLEGTADDPFGTHSEMASGRLAAIIESRGSSIAGVKRWDDLVILQAIDGFEQSEPASLSLGLHLMDRLRPPGELDVQNDPKPFAHELVVAHDSGLLTFDAFNYGQQPSLNWEKDPSNWLQQIRNIKLTTAGRDRARGRLFLVPMPVPDEDDGRMIVGSTLEEIGRALGDTFTAAQLPRFFTESQVPSEFVPTEVVGDKWMYCMRVMEGLLDGGSATRRSLREFIGRWLSDQLQESPTNSVRRRVVEKLARQGWHVRDGVLVVGPRSTADASALAPLYRDARTGTLHPDIRQVAERYLDSGHPEVAIFEAFKAVNKRVKDATGLPSDGTTLMGTAMSDTNPLVRFGDLSTQTGRDIQTGLRFMFMGAVSSLRNPDAHEQFRQLGEQEAFEELSFASMLMRRLDAADITRSS